MAANHTPDSNLLRRAHNRSISAGAGPSYGDTRFTTSENRPASSSLHPKTWEYNNEPADKLPEDVKATWWRDRPSGKASVPALRQGFESSSSVTSPRIRPIRARLTLSKIQTISVRPIGETPPSPYHEAHPKDQLDYDYAITNLLTRTDRPDEILASEPNHYDVLSDVKSYPEEAVQPMPPLPDDQISYVGSDVPDEDVTENVSADGIPARLKEHDSYKTKIRLIQLRTLLMRCQILQSTVNNIERKPWTHHIRNLPYTHYSKMRKIAYMARELAQRLESPELEARCEYWTGRGHGGTQDFKAAANHFRRAMTLDVETDTFPSGRPRLRGLRPNEKEDVQFLHDYALQREKEWQRRTTDVREAARIQAEGSNLPYDLCLDWSNISKPAWLPDQDRVMGDVKPPALVPNAESTKSEFRNECFELQQLQLEAIHDAELRRRELSGAEKSYIQRGRKRQRSQQASAEQVRLEPSTTQSRPTAQSRAQSQISTTTWASQTSLRRPINLEEELASLGAGWHTRTPSSSGSFRVFTPENVPF
ncbi:hypothetical protein J1614_000967 [Plenodomus biglobosus]|nr:hypothetical protein J1614_000967 [Plenodomus biglobosus]